MQQKAHFHLPGLFEFYELYAKFLPLFYNSRHYFYDWCDISSIYGSPTSCIWNGGRIATSDTNPKLVLELLDKYHISARLTFSNSLLNENHLQDKRCNNLLKLFNINNNGVIVHSDLLCNHIINHYPNLYLVSSTTKVITDFDKLVLELNRSEFKYVVPDFRINKQINKLNTLNQSQKAKIELLCNECCFIGCSKRKECYESVSRINLGISTTEFNCVAPSINEGYTISKAMENPSFISVNDIINIYIPNGINNFKIEGRGLGSAIILELLIYYLVKPEYQIHVREHIYLDNMLDLF